MTAGNSFGSGSDTGVSDQFPVGLRVLVVDDDVICLKILEQMLRRCSYNGKFMFMFRIVLRLFLYVFLV